MPRLIRNRTLVDDPYTLLREAVSLADIPDAIPVIVPLALWLERRAALIARGEAGTWLMPGDDPRVLADDVHRLPVIAIDFPKLTDGRGYSHARLLRERYRYRGELRATGDIGRGQFYYLAQCGFDAFAIADARSAEDALRGFADFREGYRATVTRPAWLPRRQSARLSADARFPPA
ncbi:MAG TPA: DUF934 domain-containing protein [Casimicrobiaceae bacterium]